MPQNRYQQTREEKLDELTVIAGRLFLEKGYEGTTIAEIAREAGIATNVVHWYFANKDLLFVAVLESLQSQGLAKLKHSFDLTASDGKPESLVTYLTDLVCRRLDLYQLIATVHDRSHHSPAVAAFHDEAHHQYRVSLEQVLHQFNLRDAERDLVIEALITAMEGLVMHQARKRDVKRMMQFLVERLIHS